MNDRITHSDNHESADEFDVLIWRYLDQTIDNQGIARLRQIMRNEPALVDQVADYLIQEQVIRSMHLVDTSRGNALEDNDTQQQIWDVLFRDVAAARAEKMLREDQRQQQQTADCERTRQLLSRQFQTLPSAPTTRHYVIPKAFFYGSIAAAIAVVAMIFWPSDSPISAPSPVPDRQASSEHMPQFIEVATLVEEVDTKWDAGLHRITRGGPIFNEPIRLLEGYAKLRFLDEAEVILEAPCSFEPVSASEIRITKGRLVGKCPTESSKGFIVRTPNARIIDRGTEFGVVMDADGALETHVLNGEVALTPLNHAGPQETVSLEAGAARRVSADAQRVTVIDVDAYQFVRGMKPEERDPMRRYVHLVKSLKPVVYYRFESLTGGIVNNEMGDFYQATAHGDVTIVDVAQGNGVRFASSQREGYVLLENSIAELEDANEYTLECWVRPDVVRTGWIVCIENRAGNGAGGLVVHNLEQELRPEFSGKVRFLHRNPPGPYGGTPVASPQEYIRRKWMHVVGVKTKTEATLYINGQSVADLPDNTNFIDDEFTTMIGMHTPGNGIDQGLQFVGLLDELAIYPHALTKDDIEEHYEEGTRIGLGR